MAKSTITNYPNALLDEDNMASDSATQAPTQQSVKAYVDTQIAGISSGGLTPLNTTTASSDATIDITSDIDSTYDVYEIHLVRVVPASDGAYLNMYTSTDGGSSFDTGGTDYAWSYLERAVGTTTESGSGGSGFIRLSANTGIGNQTDEGVNGVIKIWNPSASLDTYISWELVYNSTGPYTPCINVGGAKRVAVADVDAIRLSFSTGNVASGRFHLYGYTKPT